MIEKSKKSKDKKSSTFSSRADYDFELGNARLVLELDDNIVKHFKKMKLNLNALKQSR